VETTKEKIIGRNPDLADLDQGDLKHIDFRSVCFDFENKLDFDPTRIGIQNPILKGLF
jgi:hypothetical protein